MSSKEEDDAYHFKDLSFEGDLAVLDAFVDSLRISEEHKDIIVQRRGTKPREC